MSKDINWEVTYYGLHSYLLYFPLIFVIPHILSINDVRRIGVSFLILSIPVAVLAIMQYASPPNSWLNIGVGGEGSSTFGGVSTFIRPASIFSFISGLVAFQGVVGLFLSCFLFDSSERKKNGISLWFFTNSISVLHRHDPCKSVAYKCVSEFANFRVGLGCNL